jgi:hypothetical protein
MHIDPKSCRASAKVAFPINSGKGSPSVLKSIDGYGSQDKAFPGNGRSNVVWFRLYFFDWRDRIAARDEFEAEDDRSAIAIAKLLHDAFSDCSPRFELWQGARRLVPEDHQGPAKPSQCITDVTARVQEIVLEREETLQRSLWSIATSKRLIARIDQLRTEVSRDRRLFIFEAHR